MTSFPPDAPPPAGPGRPRGSRRRTASGRRTALRRLDTATTAYLRAPGPDTLQAFLRACGPALHDISTRPPEPQIAAEVVQQAALAHLHAFHHLGGTEYAEIAAELLHTLIDRAPMVEMRLGARGDLATLEFGRYLDDGTPDRLQHCVDLYEEALQECPAGYTYRPVLLGGLGNALVELSRRDNRRDLLDRSVRLHTEAVDETGADARSRTALLVNLATALVARYQRLGDLADLRRAGALHDEVAAAADGDEQVDVARAELLWERYAVEDDPSLLTAAAAILEQVVDTVPDTVPLWRTAAINLANARLERRWRFGDQDGDQDAVQPLLDAVARVVRPGTADRVRLRHVEGRRHWQAYLTSGDLRRLAEALTAWQDAADGTPPEDPTRAMLLNSVAVGVLQHAEHETAPDTALAAAEEAVTAARRAVDATVPRTAPAALAWNTLGQALALRHRRSRNFADICDAVEAWRTAVDLSPRGSRSRAGHLGGLAVGLRERAAAGPADAAAADLREAVVLHREAVALMAESTELPGLLTNLGMTLHGLAAVTGDPAAYLEAREVFRQALTEGREIAAGQALDAALAWRRLAADGLPVWSDIAEACHGALDAIRRLHRSQVIRADKETWLRTTVGVTAWACRAHLELGNPGTAVLAVESGRGLMLSETLPPVGLERIRPELFDRFRRATAAVERLQQTPDLPRPSSGIFNNDLADWYERIAIHLSRMVGAHDGARPRRPDRAVTDHPEQFGQEALQAFQQRIRELGDLQRRAVATGDLALMDEFVQRTEDVLADPRLAGLPLVTRLGVRNYLAQVLRLRHVLQGSVPDLRRAIDLWESALILSTEHRERGFVASFRNNLAFALDELFVATGGRGLLERALAHAEAAVAATDPESADWAPHLSTLGLRRVRSYQVTGDIEDLDAAILVLRQAVNGLQADTGSRADVRVVAKARHNLAAALFQRYLLRRDRVDAREARHLSERSLADTDEVDPEYWVTLQSLAVRLLREGSDEDDLGLVREAVTWLRRARTGLNVSAPLRLSVEANLSSALAESARLTGARDLLTESVDLARSVVRGTPAAAPALPGRLVELGDRWRQQHAVTGDGVLLHQADEAWRRACDVGVAVAPDVVVRAGVSRAEAAAARADWMLAAEAYGQAVEAVHLLWRAQVRRTHREERLESGGAVHRQAALAAVKAGDLLQAVVRLEQGRALALSEWLGLQGVDLDHLTATGHGHLADRLTRLQVVLRAADGGRAEIDAFAT